MVDSMLDEALEQLGRTETGWLHSCKASSQYIALSGAVIREQRGRFRGNNLAWET